jgi:hypothetical protein
MIQFANLIGVQKLGGVMKQLVNEALIEGVTCNDIPV